MDFTAISPYIGPVGVAALLALYGLAHSPNPTPPPSATTRNSSPVSAPWRSG